MTRYLLIAAYLASYNPSKMDSRLFGDGESLSKRKSKFDQLERKVIVLYSIIIILIAIEWTKSNWTQDIFS